MRWAVPPLAGQRSSPLGFLSRRRCAIAPMCAVYLGRNAPGSGHAKGRAAPKRHGLYLYQAPYHRELVCGADGLRVGDAGR